MIWPFNNKRIPLIDSNSHFCYDTYHNYRSIITIKKNKGGYLYSIIKFYKNYRGIIKTMKKKLTIAIAGLGSRGHDAYAHAVKLFPDQLELTAIADINPERIAQTALEYHIPSNRCFSSAEQLLEQECLADILFLCTQDRQHVPQALPALKKGYHLLLEKPISPNLDECIQLLQTAQKYKRTVVVCHVLRYTPFYGKLKELIDSGIIGDIMTVQAIENVGYYHQAHSFVRGNWRREDETSPMILAKCCHDMDMLLWLTKKTCRAVSSFGALTHFKPDCAPKGAAKRCMDGCKVKETCPYDAEKIYITDPVRGIANGHTGWPVNILDIHPTVESITNAIKTGPYGRCVYHCDNNVVDHQVVNLDMTDGTTINFTMSGFTSENCRYTKIMGTLGDIVADMGKNQITVTRFGQEPETIDITKISSNLSGHGGGDMRMVQEFIEMLLQDNQPSSRLTSLDRSLESHFIALAAEESRTHGGRCIEIQNFYHQQ